MGKPLPNDYGKFSIDDAAPVAKFLWRLLATGCNYVISFITAKSARFVLTNGDDEIAKTDNSI